VKNGAHHHIDRIRLTDFHQSPEEPPGKLFTLLGRYHGLIVFQVVPNNQVGPMRPMAHAAHLLAGADAPDLDPVIGDDLMRPPNRPSPHSSGKSCFKRLLVSSSTLMAEMKSQTCEAVSLTMSAKSLCL